jgi:hypothetical protein
MLISGFVQYRQDDYDNIGKALHALRFIYTSDYLVKFLQSIEICARMIMIEYQLNFTFCSKCRNL